ncbi:Ank2 [Symbiodinium pilosum]|uniref:Ank2 protein n=1 Tax=Symbiodinium pilosum TaxID=2952 RepID=A0A812YA77_SYMPI|nr:Ank2 [Symbiodinium pilosum]
MLTVRLVSGELLAKIPTQELSTVKALKQRLHGLCDAARFRQRLLHDGRLLEDDERLDGPLELQLVLLNFISPSREQVTEIMSASRHGNVSELEEILCRPQDPNHFVPPEPENVAAIPDDFPLFALSPLSPLQMAAIFGELDAMHLLLEARADIGPAHCSIKSLTLVSQRGSLDAMKLLLEARADAGNALSTAAGLGKAGAVQVLLKAGAQKDLEDSRGVTRLLEACWSGHVYVVQLLLAAGAKPAACSKKGLSYLAASQGRGLLQSDTLQLCTFPRERHRIITRLLIPRLLTVSRWSRAKHRVTHQLVKARAK